MRSGRAGVLATSVLALGLLDGAHGSRTPPPKHLVVVLGDDYGSYDGGAYRGGRIPTPTVDALVAKGLLMCVPTPPPPRTTPAPTTNPATPPDRACHRDSFYVFQICSPTRSSLVSGRYPFHVSQSLPEGFHAISRAYELLPAFLKRAGKYVSYHVGKWHMGFYNESYTPHGQGFDHSFGFLCACHDVNHWSVSDVFSICFVLPR